MMVREKLRVQCTGPECRDHSGDVGIPPRDRFAPTSRHRRRFATWLRSGHSRSACAPLRSPQTEKQMMQSDVLIIGAGPTGLVLALWLTKLGVKVRIIDKTEQPGTTSRALAVQARTLELYRQLDLTDEVLEQGHKVPGINLWVQGKNETRISFETIAEDLTPYGPFIFPQDQHERLLITRLEKLGV